MQRFRIALVTYAMHCGGVEVFLLRLGRFLSQSGCDVELITTEDKGEWCAMPARYGIGSSHIPRNSFTSCGHAFRVGRRLARGHYDAVLLNYAKYAQASLALLPNRVIAITILHNDVDFVYRVGCANRAAWNLAVCVSPKVFETAKARLAGRPVVEMPHGVDLPDESAYEARRAGGGQMRLLYAGRLYQPQKNILLLPDILKGCVDRGLDVHLLVVGDGPDEGVLRQQMSSYGLDGRVTFAGACSPDLVYPHYLDSHILLLPSFYEGIGLTLLEAMACGCVPVASRLKGVTDSAIEDGCTGALVDVGDAEGFADRVAGFYSDLLRWNAMSSAAHARVVQKFTVETMGRAYLELISDAMAGRYPLPRSRRFQLPLDPGLVTWREF